MRGDTRFVVTFANSGYMYEMRKTSVFMHVQSHKVGRHYSSGMLRHMNASVEALTQTFCLCDTFLLHRWMIEFVVVSELFFMELESDRQRDLPLRQLRCGT